MTLLQVDHLSFGFGADVLFEDVSFTLAAGDRLALVAPNGQGKSTLLKLIAGDLVADEGRVLRPKNVSLGYLRQSHEPESDATLYDVLMAPFESARAAHDALRRAEHEAASGTAKALEALAREQDRYATSGAETIERDVTNIAVRVGFSTDQFERRVGSLSGGERGRLQLAALLAAKPDVLLLDEPTNHLDIATVEWLEGVVKSWKGAVIVVSHDRAFLDATCSRTAELGMFRFRLYSVSYGGYLVQREEDLARERAEVTAQREEIARTEEFIRRNIAGQKTNQAKSRRRMLEKIARLENPEDIWADARKLGLRFATPRRSGDLVLEASGLRASRGGRLLFADVSLQLRRMDRLAIVGPNGAGKSTLLKILAGNRDPTDLGDVRLGTNLDMAYFDQHLESLDPTRSCVDIVRSVRPDMVVDAARQYLARFRFWGDDPFRSVGSLSGGERTRLALAKMLLVQRNFLLLDEPTNHLDIPACEILEEALVHFEGTVVVVSHDRRFLERLSTRLMIVDNAKVEFLPYGYKDHIARQRPAETPTRASEQVRPDKDARRSQHETARQLTREREKRQRRIGELERSLATAEAELSRLRSQLANTTGESWEKVVELANQEQELANTVDQWTDEWVRLSEQEPS